MAIVEVEKTNMKTWKFSHGTLFFIDPKWGLAKAQDKVPADYFESVTLQKMAFAVKPNLRSLAK